MRTAVFYGLFMVATALTDIAFALGLDYTTSSQASEILANYFWVALSIFFVMDMGEFAKKLNEK